MREVLFVYLLIINYHCLKANKLQSNLDIIDINTIMLTFVITAVIFVI